jgi:hypothetical protein|tara:strand:- start:2311 stop:2661 length:351 start_codon:yes stop_codon:yes gene_type:complete
MAATREDDGDVEARLRARWAADGRKNPDVEDALRRVGIAKARERRCVRAARATTTTATSDARTTLTLVYATQGDDGASKECGVALERGRRRGEDVRGGGAARGHAAQARTERGGGE